MPGPVHVLAHGVGGREALPLPFDLVVRGAAVALLASFLALGVLWRSPRLRRGAAGKPLPAWMQNGADSRGMEAAGRAVGLIVTGYIAAAAVFGRPDALNPAPYAVYVLFWVGVPFASVVFGPVWRRLNPLRGIHAALARLLRVDPRSGLLDLPAWVGYRPAAVSLASFVWLELAAPGGATVPVLRWYFGLYAAAHLAAAVIFGSRWFSVGDGFEVYSSMVGRLSPVGRRDDGRLVVRNPLDGVATFAAAPGVVALVAVLLGSTAFDSVSGAPAGQGWRRACRPLAWLWTPRGCSPCSASSPRRSGSPRRWPARSASAGVCPYLERWPTRSSRSSWAT